MKEARLQALAEPVQPFVMKEDAGDNRNRGDNYGYCVGKANVTEIHGTFESLSRRKSVRDFHDSRGRPSLLKTIHE
jgi:hypothetical protein